MALNLFYAAHTYVDEWFSNDGKSVRILRDPQITDEEACRELMVVARHYSVIRTIRIEKEGTARLSPVWAALKCAEKPNTADDAVAGVEEMVATLRPTYGKDLWSAASKFLWMRFGSPIVIYDSLAWNWMTMNHKCPSNGSYRDYCGGWRVAFDEHRQEIEEACKQLDREQRFFCPPGTPEVDFSQTVSSSWFAERVFDHAIITDI